MEQVERSNFEAAGISVTIMRWIRNTTDSFIPHSDSMILLLKALK